MIKIEKTEVYGWEASIRGMRSPMNSWEQSDSGYFPVQQPPCNDISIEYVVGKKDLDLMMRLSAAGSDHAKYLRMIAVTCDITAPLYWWKEYDTYKVGTVANSCSTMHRIHAKEFTMDDFSHEHLEDVYYDISFGNEFEVNGYMADEDFRDFYYSLDADNLWFTECLKELISYLNVARTLYLKTKDKKYWWQMIQLLPSSYNQKRTVLLNYQVLKNIYFARKNHKLDEWHDFCDWIETLPYSEIITGEKK